MNAAFSLTNATLLGRLRCLSTHGGCFSIPTKRIHQSSSTGFGSQDVSSVTMHLFEYLYLPCFILLSSWHLNISLLWINTVAFTDSYDSYFYSTIESRSI